MHFPKQLARFIFVAAAALCALGAGAQAPEPYPARSVRIIVAFPPGGGTDIVARVLGQKLSEAWGQPVVVENRAGAAGIIGTEAAARSAPDGYTLFMGTLGNLSVNKHLYAKMTVDPLKEFAPLTQVVAVNFVMVAHPSLPAKNVPELIALAREKPGQINYASSGAGGAPHLGAELFQSMANVKLVHVPYKGSGPSFNDLLAGQVSLTCDSLVQSLPHIRAGRLKALAVLGPKRTPLLPDVPTVGESVPGFELTNWFGLVVPAGTPPDRIAKLYADVSKALQHKDVGDKFTEMGADPVGSTPEQFGAFMRSESEKWARLIKEANIRAE
ncbi:MAG: Bug family tripartite tricarboxylate transporter substrate binding protein [Bacteroidota bacterium]